MPALEIIFSVKDEAKKDATFSLFMPLGFSIADYLEAAIGIGEFIDFLVKGKIKSIAELCIVVDISSLTANVADVDADVEDIGAFQFTTGLSTLVALNIPCLDEAVVLPLTNELDQSNAIVASIIALMETGVSTTGGQILPCDIGEEDVSSTIYARERSRNSGKAQ